VNVETKEQLKQWVHAHSPNKAKKFKQTSACQKADGNCFLGQERSAYGGIHATKDHNDVRRILQSTKKKKQPRASHSEQRHGVLTSSVMLLQHLSTAGAFKLGVV
jgi:hypothetical protein